ncbi:GGDEF domain-containing protein [Intestinibacillus massiliensis]|nr:GGDEF domain-containing protein [Intestinibacillus massiliensis]
MDFFTFLKDSLSDGRQVLRQGEIDQRQLPPELLERLDTKNAVTNVHRLVPFSVLIFLIEILNQVVIFTADVSPAVHEAYLAAGGFMMMLMAVVVVLAYRFLTASMVDRRHCKCLYRTFWWLFTVNMLVFVCLEIVTRNLTNNYFYLLILTAAFPLLSRREAFWLFGLDAVVTITVAVFHGFTPQQLLQLPLIALFALILSRVLYNAHRGNDITLGLLEASNQKLSALARTDPLTGLLNRRGIQEALGETLAQKGDGCGVVFLMVDIDLFKSYNDRFGHNQGDVCLQTVANTLRRCVRGSADLAARIGGEEFLMALIDCPAVEVLPAAERLRQAVLNLGLEAATGAVNRCVTVSVGTASAKTPIDFVTLYNQADKALYRAKNSGRNCVVLGNGIDCNPT